MSDDRNPDDLPQFYEVIQRMREGELNDKLTEATQGMMRHLLDRQRDIGGKPEGKLVLTMKYTLDDGMLDLRATFAVTTPKVPVTRGVFYVKSDGSLTTLNPAQRSLPFGVTRDAAAHPRRLRDVNNND